MSSFQDFLEYIARYLLKLSSDLEPVAGAHFMHIFWCSYSAMVDRGKKKKKEGSTKIRISQERKKFCSKIKSIFHFSSAFLMTSKKQT